MACQCVRVAAATAVTEVAAVGVAAFGAVAALDRGGHRGEHGGPGGTVDVGERVSPAGALRGVMYGKLLLG